MTSSVAKAGYLSGLAAFAATVAYDVVQILQIVGVLGFPLDEILIYGTSLCIVPPLILEMLAFYHTSRVEVRYWAHAALIFTVIYAVFVTANYVVQLATVIPSQLRGEVESIRLLMQTPHSLFWDFDAVGYIALGIATLLAVPALKESGFDRWVKVSFVAHAGVTLLIGIVYFYPTFSEDLLMLGLPWAVTAPLFMLMLALLLRGRQQGDV